MSTLQAFVSATHGANMFAGFAGSLRAEHVPDLLEFAPTSSASAAACAGAAIATDAGPDAVRAMRRAVPFCDSRVPLAGGWLGMKQKTWHERQTAHHAS